MRPTVGRQAALGTQQLGRQGIPVRTARNAALAAFAADLPARSSPT
jgi:hypothetical protein